ncbi:G-protein alpha subunit-domain-containing protein [Mycena galopus ATCC 62051]|nr:G-protein alpha subunit-domain-containing protein [Mycena galopus ATCC 62051]
MLRTRIESQGDISGLYCDAPAHASPSVGPNAYTAFLVPPLPLLHRRLNVRTTVSLGWPTPPATRYAPALWIGFREIFDFVTEAGLRAGTEFYITEFCGNISLISTWLPYLPDVQAILFLAPLVFWQYLDEDPKVNRVQESFEHWRVIVGNSLFSTTTLILLFNKKDLLQKQIDAGVKTSETSSQRAIGNSRLNAGRSYVMKQMLL